MNTSPAIPDVVQLPGQIQAEDYRDGGEGIGYFDTTPWNQGGVYRDDAVDIQASWHGDDRYHVAWIAAGEWLAYDVEFGASGDYVFVAYVATTERCRVVQSLRFELDDADVSGELRVPYTGSWQRWEPIQSRPASIEAGRYTLKVVAESSWFNLDRIEVRNAASESTTMISLPGRFQAEDYLPGGPGVGYHDTTEGNHCGAYRNDDVDIQRAFDDDGGYNVGWIDAGEWLAYDIDFSTSGRYEFTFRVATIRRDQSLHVLLNDVNVTGSVEIPITGGWQKYADVSSMPVDFQAGSYTLKIVAESRGFNLNYVDVSAMGAALSPDVSFPVEVLDEEPRGGSQVLGQHDTTFRFRAMAPTP